MARTDCSSTATRCGSSAALTARCLHLDARTGLPVSGDAIPVDAGAGDLILTQGSLWVANKSALSVTRVDPRSGRVLATIPVGDGPSSLAASP